MVVAASCREILSPAQPLLLVAIIVKHEARLPVINRRRWMTSNHHAPFMTWAATRATMAGTTSRESRRQANLLKPVSATRYATRLHEVGNAR